MINTAETQPPVVSIGQIINAGETIPPESASPSGHSTSFLPGESVADSFVIRSLMEKQGKQSNVYLAQKWGRNYVVKVYHNGWHPSGQMQSFLTSVQHPNIASVIECGDQDGNYYEIYDYYSEGTLEDAGALSIGQIQKVVVPSINEGLHELHRNGIIHCDIKPSNLFFSDDESRVVIGDCGISGYTNSNGKLIDIMRGTPEYAPPVRSLLYSATMTPAYDYGSFGLVLCKCVLGHSIFSGMSLEEIARTWENGLEFPSQISGRIGQLIKGLLQTDEEQRWGYAQVKKWCEGEFISSKNRNIYQEKKKESVFKPLIFGRFDGQTVSVSTMHQLAKTVEQHWAQAVNLVKRRELVEFVRQFDKDNKELEENIRALARIQDGDAAVFKLLMYIGDDSRRIVYCGKEYGELSDYVEELSLGKDEIAKRFLSSGMLVFYLRYNDFEKAQVDKLEALIKRSGCNDMASVTTICLALQGKKSLDLYGTTVESLNALVPIIARRSVREIDELLVDDHFIAWMNRLGYEKEMRRMKEATGTT